MNLLAHAGFIVFGIVFAAVPSFSEDLGQCDQALRKNPAVFELAKSRIMLERKEALGEWSAYFIKSLRGELNAKERELINALGPSAFEGLYLQARLAAGANESEKIQRDSVARSGQIENETKTLEAFREVDVLVFSSAIKGHAWQPTGSLLAVHSSEELQVYDLSTRATVFSQGPVRFFRWSPDGSRFMYASEDKVHFHDTSSGEPIAEMDFPGETAEFEWIPGSSDFFLIKHMQLYFLRQLAGNTVMKAPTSSNYEQAYARIFSSFEGSTVLTGGPKSLASALNSGLAAKGISAGSHNLSFPDLLNSIMGLEYWTFYSQRVVWRRGSGAEIGYLGQMDSKIEKSNLSSQFNAVVTIWRDGEVKIVSSKDMRAIFSQSFSDVKSADVSPDERFAVIASGKKEPQVYRVKDRVFDHSLSGADKFEGAIRFSPNGRSIYLVPKDAKRVLVYSLDRKAVARDRR